MNANSLSPLIRGEVTWLIKSGWPLLAISQKLKISVTVVEDVMVNDFDKIAQVKP